MQGFQYNTRGCAYYDTSSFLNTVTVCWAHSLVAIILYSFAKVQTKIGLTKYCERFFRIIGDIAGSRFEFTPTNDYNFELFTKACDYTDDTICTVAVADALLRGRDFGESIHDWCNRYPRPTGGYGIRFAEWVHSAKPEPYNSFGNGAAMQVSPVGCWYKSRIEVLDAATALPSHNHPEGIKGAQTVALAIFQARQYKKQEALVNISEILKLICP